MQRVVSGLLPINMEYQNSLAVVSQNTNSKEIDGSSLTRYDFPDDFIFGTATSAYQVEGGARKDGRTASIWDAFSILTPDKIEDGSNGNVAADTYTRYKEDIIAMKNMGFDAYRFSLSWTRILPGGKRSAGVNLEGIKYYNDLIDLVIANGMKPFVTVFHFDLPQILQEDYGGFLSKKVVRDFRDYAELCFWEFGDRVKHWILINELWTYTVSGYVTGTFPPGQASAMPQVIENKVPFYRGALKPEQKIQTRAYNNFKPSGNPAKDPYIVGRNLLLAHAAAAHSYRTKFKESQKGKIGISLNCNWYEPYTNSEDDIEAAKRGLDFMIGWFLDPLLTEKYPQTMINNVGENLAHFSEQESEMVKGSIDFLGLNYYTAMYMMNDVPPPLPDDESSYYYDMHARASPTDPNGKFIGPHAASWLYIVPWGLYKLLMYLKSTYKNMLPPIYITENGCNEDNKPQHTALEACSDFTRVKYHQDHLAYLKTAMEPDPDNSENPNGVVVKGYFLWSYCDNFEWMEGYTVRFGIVHVDYRDNCTRYLKDSAMWFIKFLSKRVEGSKKRRIEDSTEDNGSVKRLRSTMEE